MRFTNKKNNNNNNKMNGKKINGKKYDLTIENTLKYMHGCCFVLRVGVYLYKIYTQKNG